VLTASAGADFASGVPGLGDLRPGVGVVRLDGAVQERAQTPKVAQELVVVQRFGAVCGSDSGVGPTLRHVSSPGWRSNTSSLTASGASFLASSSHIEGEVGVGVVFDGL
jgi:hypothetical protein